MREDVLNESQMLHLNASSSTRMGKGCDTQKIKKQQSYKKSWMRKDGEVAMMQLNDANDGGWMDDGWMEDVFDRCKL